MTGSHHILIVDDSPEDAMVYSRYLSAQGKPHEFTYSLAPSGEEGLRLARVESPDCLLLDFYLPDMNGLDFLQQLPQRDGKPTIPIIMLTGQGNEAIAVNSMKSGADDYLVKGTLTSQELKRSVLGALKNAALAQAMREHQAQLQIDQILATAQTFREGSSEIIKAIGLGMDWQACFLWIPNADQTHLEYAGGVQNFGNLTHCQNSCNPCQTFSQLTQQTLLTPGEDFPGQSWKTGNVVFVKNLTSLEHFPRIQCALDLGLTGAFALPLLVGERVIGILECWYKQPRQVSQERLSILKAFANQITRFFEHKEIEQMLRKREMEYRLVTDHVPAMIASFDHQRRYRLANQQYQEWVNQSGEAIIGHHAREVLGETLYVEVSPYMDQVLTGTMVNFELRTPQEDGTSRWLQVTYVPDRGEDQEIRGFFSLINDITHRKLSEERLRLQTQELARSNAELEQFAHIASHDLQEPLRKVQTFSDRLRSRCAPLLGKQELEYLDRMHKATNRMQTLIRDLLAFSRVGTKKNPFQPIALNEVVTEVLNDLETLISRVGATVECTPLPTVDADPTQIRQLFQNLIGNALKFHKVETPPHVQVFAQTIKPIEDMISPDAPHCYIGVRDNGIGFEQQYADRIFGVFQRLHGRDEYEGTGIGLSICKKVVERHGGAISVTSSPGEGTTFWISLPLEQPQATGTKTQAARDAARATHEAQLASCT
ncbi:ATP-binding protein [Candidatus Nitronereus thalassa]|uniref:histidine kinase n=1 Tax=Candidatus Nitronereus thalassa TaxID=3020898 RepID=A0ABU3KAY0_9BACT|nr:ATP-binding protein [Candidatus Nitronereus thalassa]MDT7043640.1 ATP-binding protein [Candidatus Nitronereus thalassa]